MSLIIPIGNTKDKELEANHHILDNYEYCNKRERSSRFCAGYLLFLSILSLSLGIILIHCSILDFLIEERIKMRPGLPPLEMWRDPEIKVKVKVYIYGIENPKEFQIGVDKKLKLKQIGPIVYSHKITQTDIVYEEDSTLSYTTMRKFEFLESESEPGIMNKSLIIVNPLIMSLATNGNYFVQFVDDVFLNRTVYEILWNGSSKLLDFFKSHFSFVLPTDNFGILYNGFQQTKERYNVQIGPKHGFENFWKINTINGKTKLGNYNNRKEFDDCPFSIVNATDGTGFPPYITKDYKIKLATARVPRYFEMDYDKEVVKAGITGYKFSLSNKNFMRTNDSSDCLGNYKNIDLPSGVIDASSIAFNNPLALSNPHFYGFSGEWENYIDGLSPNEEQHSTYMVLEPKTGIQLEAKGCLQSNIAIGDLRKMNKLKAFSNKIIPTFWIEQSVMDVGVNTEIYLGVNVLPKAQVVFTVIFILLSMFCFYKFITKLLPITSTVEPFWEKISQKNAEITAYDF